MNTSAYGYQPPKKKKKKPDTRVEVDGKPMSKYQRKLLEKGAAQDVGNDDALTSASPELERVPSLKKEFQGQFDAVVLEEAEELLREAGVPETVAVEAEKSSDAPKKHAEEKAKRIRVDYRNEACYESFPCAYCGKEISPEGAGSDHRNHCPHCLHSLHVDETPGDRASSCHGDMEPISIWVKDGGEWALVHRCRTCGKLSTNRVLADDNPVALMSLAVKALANPPFPLRMLSDYLEG